LSVLLIVNRISCSPKDYYVSQRGDPNQVEMTDATEQHSLIAPNPALMRDTAVTEETVPNEWALVKFNFCSSQTS